MKGWILLFLLCLTQDLLLGQRERIKEEINGQICDVFVESYKLKTLHIIDSILLENPSNSATLKGLRAIINSSINQRTINNKGKKEPIVDEIIQDFSEAIEKGDPRYNELFKYSRVKFIYTAKIPYKGDLEEFKEMKSIGYKVPKTGTRLGLVTKYASDGVYLGGEFSIFGGSQPAYKLKPKIESELLGDNSLSIGVSVFTFSGFRNFSSKVSEFNMSLLKMNDIFYIDVTQFGMHTSDTGNKWYYRPELGIGYNGISLSYGYNVYFYPSKVTTKINNRISLRCTVVL
jgi:hypothetical protein